MGAQTGNFNPLKFRLEILFEGCQIKRFQCAALYERVFSCNRSEFVFRHDSHINRHTDEL